ncbi:hypothetical protein Vafri_14097 [Volvox africanus]|uniref:Uncharacterized protein n=1 Tax=Volvox africanus TaxID=51714 RepID=A0A8J4BF41_9CHLO|nr:hypothetical protein Vafri_14097 [Volvox africanus]
MKRTTCVGYILALLLCVGGQQDGSQWQDKTRQYYHECEHDQQQQEQHQDAVAVCGHPTGTHQQQSLAQRQWVQEKGMSNANSQEDLALVTENQSTQPREQERYVDAEAAEQGYLVQPESDQARVAMGNIAGSQYELYMQGTGQLNQDLQQLDLHQGPYLQQQYSVDEAGGQCDTLYTDVPNAECPQAEEHAKQATHSSAEMHDYVVYNAAAAFKDSPDADRGDSSDNSADHSAAAAGSGAKSPVDQFTEHSIPAESSFNTQTNAAQHNIQQSDSVDLNEAQSFAVAPAEEQAQQVDSQQALAQNSDWGQQQPQQSVDLHKAQSFAVAPAEEQAEQLDSQQALAQNSDWGQQQPQQSVDLHEAQSFAVAPAEEQAEQVDSQQALAQNSDWGQQQPQQSVDLHEAQSFAVAPAEEQAEQLDSQQALAQNSDWGQQQPQQSVDLHKAQSFAVAPAEEQAEQLDSQQALAQNSDWGQQQPQQSVDLHEAQSFAVAPAEEQAEQVDSQQALAQNSDWGQQQPQQSVDLHEAQSFAVAPAEEQAEQLDSQQALAQNSDWGQQQPQQSVDLHKAQSFAVAPAEEQAEQVDSQQALAQNSDWGQQQPQQSVDLHEAQSFAVAPAEEQAEQVDSQQALAQNSDLGQQQQQQSVDLHEAQSFAVAPAEEQAQQVDSQQALAQNSDWGQQQPQQSVDLHEAQSFAVAPAEEQAEQVDSQQAQAQNSDLGQQQPQQSVDLHEAQSFAVAPAVEQAEQLDSQQALAQNSDWGQHEGPVGVVKDSASPTILEEGNIAAQLEATATTAQVAAETEAVSSLQSFEAIDPAMQQRESQIADQETALLTYPEETLPLTAAEAVSDAVSARGSSLEDGRPDSSVDATGRVSDTDAAAVALTEVAQAEASRGPSHFKPATVVPRGDGTFEAASETDRVAAQAAAEAASLHPLRGIKKADIETKLLEAQGLIYANTSGRNMTAGLTKLRELHEIVEAALPSSPMSRARVLPPPAADGKNSSSVENQTTATDFSNAPPPRPLALEVAESRHAGLHTAAAATFQLAALHSSGVMPPDVMPYDPMSAMLALHQAARAGSLEALMALADRYAQGIGTPASCSRGLQYGKLAAMYLVADVEKEQRYASSLSPVSLRERFADGSYVAAEDAENGQHVINLEEDMAFRGNPDAIRRMAYRRLMGRGMEADPEGAFHDFQIAAAQGDPYAVFNIGYMYLRGLYVPQNFTAAKEQFEKAAQKGLPSAHNGLGVLAWNGQGMAPNLTAARESFERGALLNNSDSVYNLATMHFHGAGTPVNQTLALDLFKRALELGHWRAPYMMALAYEAGAGVEANCSRAMQYLRLLFADRSTWGKQLTAAVRLLDSGDDSGALLTYITVAEQGSSTAAANAAWLLRRRVGYSGPDADRLAAKYFQRAAKQGHTSSMVELAHMILEAAIRAAAPSSAPAPAPAPAGQPASITAPVEGMGPAGTERTEREPGVGVPSEAVPLSTVASSSGAEGNPSGAAADVRVSTGTVDGVSTTAAAVAGEALQGVGDRRASTHEVSTDGAAITGDPTATSAPLANTIMRDTVAAPAGAGNGDGGSGDGSVAATVQSAAADTSSANSSANSSGNVSSIPKTFFNLPPLKSSTKRPAPPPLVNPAALPNHRVVLGVSKAADAVAWYRAAAAAGDPEGLFYLGWVYYHGVGVAENATFAKLLWIRSLEASGLRSTRALAPLLALAGMRIDGWLAPLVGHHALARGIAQLQRGQYAMRALVSLSGTGGLGKPTVQGDTGVDAGAENGAVGAGYGLILRVKIRSSLTMVKTWVGQLVAAGGEVDSRNLENAVLLGLLAALLVVMLLRRQRLAVRT